MARNLALLFVAVVALCLATASLADALQVAFATRGLYTMTDGSYRVSCSPFSADAAQDCGSLGLGSTAAAGSPQCCQSQTRWGRPYTSNGNLGNTNSHWDKSGLGFSGMGQNGGNTQNPIVRQIVSDTTGTPFLIGMNTHYNFPIQISNPNTAASRGNFGLTLFSVQVTTTGQPQSANDLSFSFGLTVEETPNDGWDNGRGCAYTTRRTDNGVYVQGWKNDVTGADRGGGVFGCTSSKCPCADRIYFDNTAATTASGVIRVGGSNYTITMAGFSDSSNYQQSQTATSFISQEGDTTTKFLFAAMTIVCQCPPPKVTASNDICDCQCPIDGPTSQADCPVDYLFNTATCKCVYQNNDCLNQRLALSPPLDPLCESYTCVQVTGPNSGLETRVPYVGPVYTLNVTGRATNASCGSSQPDQNLCTKRCVKTGLRSTCVNWGAAAPSCSTSQDCKVSKCNVLNGQCALSNAASGTSCVGAALPCNTYKCNSAGTCVGTPVVTCPGATRINGSCGCSCPAGSPATSQADCSSGFTFNSTSCTCQELNCAVGFQALGNNYDARCETPRCVTATQTIVFDLRDNGAPCSTNPDSRCPSRCYRPSATRSSCNTTAVVCPAAPTCKTAQCNAGDATCSNVNQPDGSSCSLGVPCWSYQCVGGTCQGTDPCPGVKEPSAAPACTCQCPPKGTGGSTAASQADCDIDWEFQPATCSCKPSGVCTKQIQALNPPLDEECETAQCPPATSVLTVVAKANNTVCDAEGNPNLCNARCIRTGARAKCNVQPVKCSGTIGCVSTTCDTSDGVCKPSTLTAGTPCTPTSTAGCTTYTCDANAQCVGQYQCELDQTPSQLKCRQYTCDTASDPASPTYNKCIFQELNVTDCDDSPCSERSECVAGTCKSYNFDCATQEAVDAGLQGASTTAEDCLARICKYNTTTNSAACEIDYYYDKGTPCPNKDCKVNSECDGEGVCRGETDPDCSGGGDSRKAEIIGSAAAGGVLSVVGAGAVLFAAAGAGVLAWQIRRRKLLNFESWEAGTMSGATVSPLYVPTGTEHVNPLSEL